MSTSQIKSLKKNFSPHRNNISLPVRWAFYHAQEFFRPPHKSGFVDFNLWHGNFFQKCKKLKCIDFGWSRQDSSFLLPTVEVECSFLGRSKFVRPPLNREEWKKEVAFYRPSDDSLYNTIPSTSTPRWPRSSSSVSFLSLFGPLSFQRESPTSSLYF